MGFLGGDKLIIGYDLGMENAQISFAASPREEAETLSQVAGEERYSIPAVLCKRYGANLWLYGKEALRLAEENQGVLVENLLALALDGEPVMVDGESFDPVALLTLFFKRSLANLRVSFLMLTCAVFDHRAIEVLGQVAGGAGLKPDKVFFQGYGESFYSYMLRQPEELWRYESVLFYYRRDALRVYHLECNRKTVPMVVVTEEREHGFYECRYSSQEERTELDQAFCRIAQEACAGRPVGSVYLIGEDFSEEWMKESLSFLCRGRRVFQGSNLFSKGACCGMQERLEESQAGKSHVFLGREKLRANIGMEILRRGQESYYALLDAGTNWYEAGHTAEIYVQDGNELTLTVTPLAWKGPGGGAASGSSRKVRIQLEGLAGPAARIRLHLEMESEDRLLVEAEDLGFGRFRSSGGQLWRQTIEIYEATR